ncbi:hypothetical protein SAMN06265360_11734 [Haloechinothrix alba]|uniref:Uncharacterized protein n=1 Tax=Haloechinothrix alba TaxID=664784 RepID=A0A238YV38_9PSEU|nr:hypothetical protein [Haloechinothrix alba]SNR74443.1 hypothetical protein SAMN06265360_11734 [Haloechinothrix alba]
MPPADPSVLQSLVRPRSVQMAFVLWMIYVGISLVVLGLGAAHGTLSMLSVLPVVAALVFMYRSESNSFFRS